MGLTKREREILKTKYGGKCAYCGCVLPNKWHADHIEPVIRNKTGTHDTEGLDIIENMNPACPPCNISKGRMTIEVWRGWLAGHVNSLNLYSKNYRMAKAYGLVEETGNPVVFHFEKVEQK